MKKFVLGFIFLVYGVACFHAALDLVVDPAADPADRFFADPKGGRGIVSNAIKLLSSGPQRRQVALCELYCRCLDSEYKYMRFEGKSNIGILHEFALVRPDGAPFHDGVKMLILREFKDSDFTVEIEILRSLEVERILGPQVHSLETVACDLEALFGMNFPYRDTVLIGLIKKCLNPARTSIFWIYQARMLQALGLVDSSGNVYPSVVPHVLACEERCGYIAEAKGRLEAEFDIIKDSDSD